MFYKCIEVNVPKLNVCMMVRHRVVTYLFNNVNNVCFSGGRKQNIDPRFLLTKEDFLSNFDVFKKVSWLSFSLN